MELVTPASAGAVRSAFRVHCQFPVQHSCYRLAVSRRLSRSSPRTLAAAPARGRSDPCCHRAYRLCHCARRRPCRDSATRPAASRCAALGLTDSPRRRRHFGDRACFRLHWAHVCLCFRQRWAHDRKQARRVYCSSRREKTHRPVAAPLPACLKLSCCVSWVCI